MNSQPAHSECQILCGCVNTTNHLQIIRIANIPGWYFERVIFPGQRFLFEAQPEAELEVYTGTGHLPKTDRVKKPINSLAEQVLSLLDLKKQRLLLTPSLTLFLVTDGSV